MIYTILLSEDALMVGNDNNITLITETLLSLELENLKNTSLAVPGALAQRLQRRAA